MNRQTRELLFTSTLAALGVFAVIFAIQVGEAWTNAIAGAAFIFTIPWFIITWRNVLDFLRKEGEQSEFDAWDQDEENLVDDGYFQEAGQSTGAFPNQVPVNMMSGKKGEQKSPSVSQPQEEDRPKEVVEAEKCIRDAAFTAIKESFAHNTLLESDLRTILGTWDYEDTLASPDHKDGPGVLVALGIVNGRAERIPGEWVAGDPQVVMTAFRDAWLRSVNNADVNRRIERRAARLRERAKRPGQVFTAANPA